MRTSVHLKRITFIFLSTFICLSFGLIFYAPYFPAYADKPVQSDAVVLFLGSPERNIEAQKLILEGYARYLIIPINQEVLGPLDQEPKHLERWMNEMVSTPTQAKNYPAFYEDTHIEVLEAKRLMETNSLISAIFVSAPSHMHRIKIITKNIFKDSNVKVTFVQTPIDSTSPIRLNAVFNNIKGIGQEFIKIIWFLIYFQLYPTP